MSPVRNRKLRGLKLDLPTGKPMITINAPPLEHTVTLNTIEDYEEQPDTIRWESKNPPFINIPKQAVEQLIENGEVEIGVDNKKQYTYRDLPKLLPPDPPPEIYLDGRSVWTGADGATWRYNRNYKKWVRTS